MPRPRTLIMSLSRSLQSLQHFLWPSPSTSSFSLSRSLLFTVRLLLQDLLELLSLRERSVEAIVWRASLLTVKAKVYPLDDSWGLSGLGHDYMFDTQDIKRAAVLHYNGNMDQFLSECNVYS
ncbi:hypothetical protein K1719_038957 [Acacia pycnantha]|nr:hypothetical protein K1719_038957 [Acacia pycnantha]